MAKANHRQSASEHSGPVAPAANTADLGGAVPQAPVATEARDFFLPAIESNGSVSDCLAAVLGELSVRSQFVSSLKNNLEAGAPLGVDAVTDLGAKVRALDNTLRFRLGILRPERTQAWFRAPAATSTGPFTKAVMSEPVFAPYAAAEAFAVKAGLTLAWQEARVTDLPFQDQTPCLWRTLLAYNARLEAICRLPEPFAKLRLDTLPEGLPRAVESRALRAFLLNVRGEIHGTRAKLQDCYRLLFETCEKLWLVQAEEAKQRQAEADAAGASAKQRARPQSAAEDWRDEFKRRRTETRRSFLTPPEMEALKFMGFAALPSCEDLRQRYIAMAKQLHPDRQGGSDQAFKQLTSAYSRLASRAELMGV